MLNRFMYPFLQFLYIRNSSLPLTVHSLLFPEAAIQRNPEEAALLFLGKKRSENIQQIYKRTGMPMCGCKAALLKSPFGIGVLL